MSDTTTELFEILAKHFEIPEHGRGRYTSKYMPSNQIEAFLKDLWKFNSEVERRAYRKGQADMLCGLTDLFKNITDDKKKEINLKEDEAQQIQSHFNWLREKQL